MLSFLLSSVLDSTDDCVQYRDSVFRIQTCDKERIVVPNQFADELQQLGPAYLNSKDAQCERHLAWYNYMDVVKQSELHANVCRVQLTKNISEFLFLAHEARH